MALDARRELVSRPLVRKRIGEQLGINPDTLLQSREESACAFPVSARA
jgi:hypothetical protein